MLQECQKRMIALLPVLFATSVIAACPPGTVQGLGGDACYELHTNAMDFYSAETECGKKGGHLTSIGSAFENSFIRRLAENVTADRLWIGGHYSGENDFGQVWVWNDETEWTYDNWKYSGPLCRSCWSSSLQFERTSGHWYDGNYTDALPFVCLVELKPKETRCTKGWIYNPNSKLCYTSIDYRNGYTWTWPDAQSECESRYASLVSISDLATNFDILRYARDAAIGDIGLIALGLSYNKTTSAWTWSDGSLPTFTNWAAGYPAMEKYSYEDPYYVYMWMDGDDASRWRNYPYNMAEAGLLCQRPPDN